MRTHGVPNFPDPILINGRRVFGFTVKSGIDPGTPQFKKALSYCGRRYLPGFGSATPAEQAQSKAEALKFSACMRSHGVSDFPDPDAQGLINLPTANYFDTPTAGRAQAACKSFLTHHVAFGVPVP